MSLSKKQRAIFAFPSSGYDALICDGAIRSGKTLWMTVAFIDDAMQRFSNMRFGICGKTVDSATKNIVEAYLATGIHEDFGFDVKWRRSDKILEVRKGSRVNLFEIFGGKDESSYMLIQGRTLAGVLLDETALMPRSFVEQALARCSVTGSRLWFNCNPAYPEHWFNREWIEQPERHNALHLHFTMDDNPGLSEAVRKRYEFMYTGVFYDRYIRGLWVAAEGLIYPMFDCAIGDQPEKAPDRYVLSVDYGTQNAFAALLWGRIGGVWWCIKEYYYSGRETGKQKTDEDYGNDLDRFTAGIGNDYAKLKVIIDPSAASFIALLRRKKKYNVVPADNDVADGIRDTATAMQTGKIKVSKSCTAWKSEVQGYVWDEKSADDRPVKVADHCMDATRYFVKTMNIVKPKSDYIPLHKRGL